ncbi:metallophosphoesterase family protein [Sphingobacterium sp. Mn56C]|uniref:metallophosphoesterase family protein n=1 Tax=Sphingobacterium sp. Mn56C TaxID=3395261 RepID=UPI003BC76EF2
MKNPTLAVAIAFFSLLLYGCNLFEVHPYDGNIKGTKDINNSNIKLIEERYADKDTIRYAFISDSQRWYDELKDFVNSANKRDDIDFIIHGGDISDFGLTREFLWQRDILEKLKQPYVALIGNHDCLANGEEVFSKLFGNPNFSFIAGKTKFLCLNTNALESDYSNPIPNFAFIESEREKDSHRFEKTVVLMHARPSSEQFNNNVANVFQYSIKRFPDLLYCNNGHDHNYQEDDIFQDGIIYYGTPNIGKRQYLIFTITKEGYSHELVSF